jgi:predicted nucleic acid-binding protein
MAHDDVVTNAGPLIYLSVLQRFDLLRRLFDRVYLSQAVLDEVAVQGAGLPGADETRAAVRNGWLYLTAVKNRLAVDALCDELDLGEAESIVLARELNVRRVLLDDGRARVKAQSMGLSVTGTIGVLLLARRSEIDVDLRHDLDVLIQSNFRLSRELYDRVISAAI